MGKQNHVSVGDPGYVPYCSCPTMVRMTRGKDAFKCNFCGLETRIVNGQDIFDQTAPTPPKKEKR